MISIGVLGGCHVGGLTCTSVDLIVTGVDMLNMSGDL